MVHNEAISDEDTFDLLEKNQRPLYVECYRTDTLEAMRALIG